METKEVTVYGKPNCPQCDSTKAWLDDRKLPYDYKDITDPQHSDVLQDFLEQGYRAAPIVVMTDWMGTVIWAGHNEDNLEILLED